MTTATVSSKGQITIPAEVRNALKIDTGDRVQFIRLEEGRYELLAATGDITDLKGLFKADRVVSVDEMNSAVKERASRNDRS